jgi:hypothetical protein
VFPGSGLFVFSTASPSDADLFYHRTVLKHKAGITLVCQGADTRV